MENILFIKDQILLKNIISIVCICKNYGAGRQYRTIKKQLPHVKIQIMGFETDIDENGKITKGNWIIQNEWKSMIWGEYLRNCYYGYMGHILQDFRPPEEIQNYLNKQSKNLQK
jgi:hypothetical protein